MKMYFNPNSEYNLKFRIYQEEYNLRTVHLKTFEDMIFHKPDLEFENWSDTSLKEIEDILAAEIKKSNSNNEFFRGCSFKNYEINYNRRLTNYLNNYEDAAELDFANEEIEYYESSIYDLQNAEASHDGYSLTGYENFKYLSKIINIIDIKQFTFSTNKILGFLQHNISNSANLNNISSEEIIITENNVLQSTIEDYIEEFKIEINGDGYDILVNALFEYFSKGSFPTLKSTVNFKKINKKRLGWALKELYKSEKTDNLDVEYFRFAQENINLFQKEVIEIENFNKSKFYKAFTSNPAK
jgi:hypothetical protein